MSENLTTSSEQEFVSARPVETEPVTIEATAENVTYLPDNRVEDINQAHEVAEAGKPFADLAAEARQEAATIFAKAEEHAALYPHVGGSDPDGAPQLRFEGNKKLAHAQAEQNTADFVFDSKIQKLDNTQPEQRAA